MQRRLTVGAFVLMACSGREATREVGELHAGVPVGSKPAAESAGGDDPTPGDSNPFVTHALPQEQQRWLDGWVEERLVAGSYVYLRVRTTAPAGVTWVASLAMTTPDRRHVRVLVLGRAEHFHSRRLQRDFEPLLFGAVRAANSDVATFSKGT
jgi:hypothetical protein